MRKTIALTLAVLMVVGIAAVAGTSFADTHTSQITAFINRGISMTWDGRAFEPRETDGSRLHPIVYNGRTYLPAKFVADKAGVDVDWDATTQTIMFNTRVVNIDLTEPYRDASSSASSSSSGTSKVSIERLPFTKFDLDIDGDDDDDDLDVEFEIRSNGSVYAKVEIEIDDRKEVELTGQAALDYLLPIFNRMDIKASMFQREIINEVMRAFNWRHGYEEFELEVRFRDGTRIDIEIED